MGSGSGGTTALAGGRRFSDNLADLVARFPLNSKGYFGSKGEGRRHTRNIESTNPARTAAEFAQIASRNPVRIGTIGDTGMVYTMRDGTVVTHRYVSGSKDRSPVVELNVHNVSGVKSQKIHFVKRKK